MYFSLRWGRREGDAEAEEGVAAAAADWMAGVGVSSVEVQG